jgi:protein TonB
MHSLLHSLNIGTLATWLSVAGLGTVGVLVKPGQRPQPVADVVQESVLFDADFMLGDVADAGRAEGGAGAGPAQVEAFEAPPEALPTPPELPALAELSPLPEIPALPAVASAVAPAPRTAAGRTDASGIRSARSSGASTSVTSARGGSGNGAAGGGGGGGLSQAARLAAGRMPAPSYPSECRRKGQTGTVVVEFTIDSSGRVISAHAVKPSPWPLLDHEAVRTVRKWKFPPGAVMKLQRPIVFQLR